MMKPCEESLSQTWMDAPAKSYKKGSYLYHMSEEPKGLFLVKKGLVGLVTTSESGHEHMFRLFGKNQWLGHRSLLANEPYHANAKVLEDSEISFMEKAQVERLLKEQPEFSRELMMKLSKELRSAELRLASSSEKQVAARVAEALVYLKDCFPNHKWTRSEIAYYCGSTAPTVIRTLAEFEKEGLIRQEGREIEILNQSGLLSLT